MEKKCFKCKLKKDLGLFYKHSQTADGYLNKCKLCTKKDARNRYKDPVSREYIIAYEKKRQLDPKRRERKIKYQRKMRERSPGKRKARQKVNNAVRDGRLIKGLCEICGSTETQAHHTDYRKYLDVQWFCRKHHMEIENKKAY